MSGIFANGKWSEWKYFMPQSTPIDVLNSKNFNILICRYRQRQKWQHRGPLRTRHCLHVCCTDTCDPGSIQTNSTVPSLTLCRACSQECYLQWLYSKASGRSGRRRDGRLSGASCCTGWLWWGCRSSPWPPRSYLLGCTGLFFQAGSPGTSANTSKPQNEPPSWAGEPRTGLRPTIYWRKNKMQNTPINTVQRNIKKASVP